ncbi:MAG TPA: hypothetical protein VM101_12835 [Flavitalea sp.]|nr:hypothetical protein [Flavitalea sp.]
MKLLFTISIFFFVLLANGQDADSDINTSQMEDLMQDEADESENDYDIQQLKYFIRHPLDINGSELEQLTLLHALQISNLSAYRKLMGDIIDIHELQAVPGFTIELIKLILPYVAVKKEHLSGSSIHERISAGEYSLLLRPSIVPETSDGYKHNSSQPFTGNRTALMMRYKYQYRNLLQYGFIADKDPGEKLFVNGIQPNFISFHFFARQAGIFKSVAAGDYSINFGQGLIHWQSQSLKKSSSVINIKRQSDVLRPYHSAGEFNFHRGIAATIAKGNYECTGFFSMRRLTANTAEGVITSVLTSGLHRTQAEVYNKNNVSLLTSGINLKKTIGSVHIGINGVYCKYSLPVLKQDEPYNIYALRGKQWFNFSTDYSFTFRNLHAFGEFASDKKFSVAYINGVMTSLSQTADIAIIHRVISKAYQSVFGNAFTENTMPVNENGFYTGISLAPHTKWKIDLYADIFSFPWIKYRLNAPSSGSGYLVQVTYRPDKHTEIYSRFRYRLKPLNIESEEEDITMPGIQVIQNWRSQFSRQVSRTILIRSRTELCIFSHKLLHHPQNGYLFFTDVIYKPFSSWLSGSIRFQAFDAETYDARIYAFENDVLFATTTPSFYNNGIRYYLNVKAKIKLKFLSDSRLTVNMKAGSTVYNNLGQIGSGPSLIPGNRISSFRLQVFLENR